MGALPNVFPSLEGCAPCFCRFMVNGQRCVKIVHVSENDNKIKFSLTFFMNVKREHSSSRWKRPATNDKRKKKKALWFPKRNLELCSTVTKKKAYKGFVPWLQLNTILHHVMGLDCCTAKNTAQVAVVTFRVGKIDGTRGLSHQKLKQRRFLATESRQPEMRTFY